MNTPEKQQIILRRAVKEDCRQLYEWRNDPLVRKNSFHQEEIAYENHMKWFGRMMQNPLVRQFILMVGDEPAGQVRIQMVEEVPAGQGSVLGDEKVSAGQGSVLEDEKVSAGYAWEISYSVDARFRGHGLAKKMLALLEDVVSSDSSVVKEDAAGRSKKDVRTVELSTDSSTMKEDAAGRSQEDVRTGELSTDSSTIKEDASGSAGHKTVTGFPELLARVKPENIASRKVFEDLGYDLAEETREFLVFIKVVRREKNCLAPIWA